ncbi:ubiquinol-cytochrome C chaperone family protein [Aurantiacibacter sediminis]|uniref:Ubiquinol-cytochrome C chaperone family protein n=1 Tax=Aurantiacibacter sediminis TaxID=2793064 RepID=A0ABS0N1I0_9SPHN|nr:ubiquinol-cytochrome C chaperone family protein [Aurantiacibacter sediminis]MBH5321814.1 ubiquinol-cytochrome C chaperone family protein [Aurantiacibacter sediminis]
MSFWKRFLGKDGRDELRDLWHATVGTSREPEWYADCGVKDSVEGRFDMIALVMSLVMLRMENSEELAPKTALLTELFVEDMDRQLRDSGVGDLSVGKNMGKLMSAIGGRMGSLRENMTESDAKLAEILQRNMTLNDDETKPFALAVRTRALHNDLQAVDDAALIRGQLRPLEA